MKNLRKLTQDEAKFICELVDEPFLSLHIFEKDDQRDYPAVGINTTSTSNGDRYDSTLYIYDNGNMRLSRNDGEWHNGSQDKEINTLPVIDYLRMRGYDFIYPELRKIKLMALKRAEKK